MTELRQTETNAADDSAGRAFGLDGNLYLPVLLAVIGALALFALLTLVLKASLTIAALATGAPLAVVLGWAVFLKQSRPAGYDIDFLQYHFGGGDFSRRSTAQEGIAG